jgi:acyl-CoA thioester hydrolase
VTAAALPREGSLMGGIHCFPVRVYYEDTDAAGIVYYANYLKFTERARTEMIRLFGMAHEEMRRDHALAFIVRRVSFEYEVPARLDDELVVETRVKEVGGATILLAQDIKRGDATLVRSTVLIACVGALGRPARLPAAFRASLSSTNEQSRMVNAHG